MFSNYAIVCLVLDMSHMSPTTTHSPLVPLKHFLSVVCASVCACILRVCCICEILHMVCMYAYGMFIWVFVNANYAPYIHAYVHVCMYKTMYLQTSESGATGD